MWHRCFSVREVEVESGSGRGLRWLEVRNPGGMSCDLNLGGAMDIGWAQGGRIPLAWSSLGGHVRPERRLNYGNVWAETFGGGLLATCGMRSTGAPSSSNGRNFGLHGNISFLPVNEYSLDFSDPAKIVVQSKTIDAPLGLSPLVLRRTLTFSTDKVDVEVSDIVNNVGSRSAEHMFRHHINFGFPVVSSGALVKGKQVWDRWRDATEKDGELPWKLSVHPGAEEKVGYFVAGDGSNSLQIIGQELRASIDFSADSFPFLILWRDASPEVNVLGVEPSTSRDGGRVEAMNEGTMIMLEPGEARSYKTRVSFDFGCILED